MSVLQPIMDAVRFLWHDNPTVRFCCKCITCPLLGPCYYLQTRNYHSCVKNRYGESGRQLERYAVLADIEHRRRVRRVAKRKRSASIDGKSWYRKMKDQPQSSFFAKLPVELRLKIYEMVLCDQEEFGMKFGEEEPWDYWNVRAARGCDIQVLRVCKNFYREANPILYSKNTFRFDSYRLLSIFMSTIPPQHLASIRHVVLNITLFWNRSDGFTGRYRDLIPLLKEMQGLRDVCLRYRLRENSYVIHPRSGDFTLLEWLEQEERLRGYALFYEVLEVQTGPEIGGMLFDRWAIGERRNIEMKK